MKSVLPPGESPIDPAIKDIDAVAFALEKVHTHLWWIEEHRASFQAARSSKPDEAELELTRLAESTAEARLHVERLIDLLLAGYTIDRSKRLPHDLRQRVESDDQP